MCSSKQCTKSPKKHLAFLFLNLKFQTQNLLLIVKTIKLFCLITALDTTSGNGRIILYFLPVLTHNNYLTKSSVLKNTETVKTDQVVDVHVAEGCSIRASWDHDIEWEKFGWHSAGGSLSFNPVGFNENDVFARCEFPSNPASNLRWKNSAIGEERLNAIEAKVPAGNTHFADSFLECELIDKDFAEDQCDVVQEKLIF